VHARFQEWERAGLFQQLWQAVDGVMTKAPFGGARVPACGQGPNPTDRGKQGTKDSLLTDGAGIPLAIVVDGANRHDMKLLAATLDGLVVARPAPTDDDPQHVCLDAGYDYAAVRQEVAAWGYVAHIRTRGEERAIKLLHPGTSVRRWMVERTHCWLHRSRRLLAQWEKNAQNYLTFLHLACAQLLVHKLAAPSPAAAVPVTHAA